MMLTHDQSYNSTSKEKGQQAKGMGHWDSDRSLKVNVWLTDGSHLNNSSDCP